MLFRKRGRKLTFAVRLAFTAVALAFALGRVEIAGLLSRLSRIEAGAFLGLAALTTLVVTLSVVRWWRMLRRLGEHVPFRAVYADVLVGLFYNLFLPTSVGGDVVRALRARARMNAPHHAFSTSLFERIAGLFAMATTGALAVAFGLTTDDRVPRKLRVLAVGLAALFVLAFFFAAGPFRLVVRLLEARLPKAAASDVRGIVNDLEGPLATAGARIEAVAWSVLYQAATLAFVLAGAAALGAPGHERALLVGVPLVTLLSLAPISLGGHGLREGLYVGVLGALGVPGDVALGLDAQWLASSLFFALCGAVLILKGR